MTRALATLDTIAEIRPIPDADAIEAVRVRGWWVVAKKGQFVPGDLCIYFEVDSMLDIERPQFAFLAPRGVRTDAEGRTGHRLRTMKLRGQVSQGLVLPLEDFRTDIYGGRLGMVGLDVTDALGVWKWEAPVPAQLSGEVYGGLPSFVPKTDEDRVQNCYDEMAALGDLDWTATEKVDGSSMTVWVDYRATVGSEDEAPRVAGVCGRNYNLKPTEGNTMWRLAQELSLHDRLSDEYPWTSTIVLQGECYGEGIQSNPLRIKGQRFIPFTLYLDGRHVPRRGWPSWLDAMGVPVLDAPFPTSVEHALDLADRKSSVNPDRNAEGIVWSATVHGRRVSFKAISNRYLLKNEG